MSKVTFSKLGCKINTEIKTIVINGQEIEVKQYLPINEKLSLIGRIIELAHDQDYNFSNPVKADAIRDFEVLCAYTNISFTDKQKEEFTKTYDALVSSEVLYTVLDAIPVEEYNLVLNGVIETIDSVYKYQNSIGGILAMLKQDYGNLELDATKLQETIQNPENLQLLKDVLTKLG